MSTKESRRARERAMADLIKLHKQEYDELLLVRRKELGLEPRPPVRVKTQRTRGKCGNLGHVTYCLCDVMLHRPGTKRV